MKHSLLLGPSIEVDRLPSTMRAPLQFALDVVGSAISYLPTLGFDNLEVGVCATDGRLALAGACFDPPSEYFVAVDGLAPFQIYSTLSRLYANAVWGAKSALIWMSRVQEPGKDLVKILRPGTLESPQTTMPDRFYPTWTWALGFIALHELGHLIKGHLNGNGARRVLDGAYDAAVSVGVCAETMLAADSMRAQEVEADLFAFRMALYIILQRNSKQKCDAEIGCAT